MSAVTPGVIGIGKVVEHVGDASGGGGYPSPSSDLNKYQVHKLHSVQCPLLTHSLTHSLTSSQLARNCFLCHRKLPYKNIVPGLQLRPTPRERQRWRGRRRRRRRRRRRPFALGDVGRTLVRRSRVWQQGAVRLRSTIVDAVIEKGTVGVSDNHCN